jgi:hypothetical protein
MQMQNTGDAAMTPPNGPPPSHLNPALRTSAVERARKAMRQIVLELREHGLYWSEISDIWGETLGSIPNDYPRQKENRTP